MRHRVAAVAAGLILLVLQPALPSGAATPEAEAAWTLRPEPRGSLRIEGDAGFTPENGVRSGSGTAEDPFVISNWSIAADRYFGILLRDTRAHVILRDILVVHSSGAPPLLDCQAGDVRACEGSFGIDVVDSSNVTIERIRVPTASYGVSLYESQDISMSNVSIGRVGSPLFTSAKWGLDVVGSSRIDVENLIAESVDLPLGVTDSSSVRVTRSMLAGSSTIPVFDSDDVSLVQNVISGAEVFLGGDVSRFAVLESVVKDGS